MEENVLLLCMSPFTGENSGKKRQYVYEDHISVEGYATNEAPAKAIIEKLAAEGKTLDRIVMLCSEDVEKRIEKCSEELEAKVPNIRELNTREYFQQVIGDYAEKYQKKGIDFLPVSIPNDPVETKISKATVDAADLITQPGKKTDLYIDFNGGPRYIAFMLHAISILLKSRNVKVCQVLTMKREENRPTLIQNMSSIFGTVDLISGINEYINYGHIKGLRSYFNSSESKQIKDLLDEMEEFTQNLQLCRTDYIMENREKLLKDLSDYYSAKPENETADTYEKLFEFVIRDIISGYSGLLDGELPEMIRWCVNHDMIQQALTFCSEQMPQYFWDKNILRATPVEESEYHLYIKTILDNKEILQSSNLNKQPKTYERIGPNGSPYDWLVSFLTHSCWNIKDLVNALPQTAGQFPLSGQKYSINSYLKPPKFSWIPSMNNKLLKKDKEANHTIENASKIDENTKNANKTIEYASKTKRVDYSGIGDTQKLRELIYTYFALKGQRNMTNHASGGGEDDTEAWDYQDLRSVISDFVDRLKEL